MKQILLTFFPWAISKSGNYQPLRYPSWLQLRSIFKRGNEIILTKVWFSYSKEGNGCFIGGKMNGLHFMEQKTSSFNWISSSSPNGQFHTYVVVMVKVNENSFQLGATTTLFAQLSNIGLPSVFRSQKNPSNPIIFNTRLCNSYCGIPYCRTRQYY